MPDPNDIYKLDEWEYREPPDEEDLERWAEKQARDKEAGIMTMRTIDWEELVEKIIRKYYVPLYPKNKPISEMTPYEQTLLKRTKSIVSKVFEEIINDSKEKN